MTIVQLAAVTSFLAVALPLGAQQTSSAKARASQTRAAKKPASQKSAARSQQKVSAQSSTRADTAAEASASGNNSGNDSSGESYMVSRTSLLRAAPSASIIGALHGATPVDVLTRDRGWTRVRVEGWVPDSVLVPADTSYQAGLSAADLRADPAATRGKTVVWTVQFLALQTADPLRQGMTDGEPYILARGPDSENALLYLVVPPSLMGTARALQPLARITVTARVRDGRSEPVGVPVLDIQTIRRIR